MSSTELIIIAVVLLVLFGNNKMKELARGLGESTREFKKVQKDIDKALDETTKKGG